MRLAPSCGHCLASRGRPSPFVGYCSGAYGAPTPSINVSIDAPLTAEDVVGEGTSDATVGRGPVGSLVALIVTTMASVSAVATLGSLAV